MRRYQEGWRLYWEGLKGEGHSLYRAGGLCKLYSEGGGEGGKGGGKEEAKNHLVVLCSRRD